MDISVVIYTGLGASLGTLIAGLLNKLHKSEDTTPRVYNVFLIVAGLTILPLMYRNMYLPRIVPIEYTSFGEHAELYQTLKKHDLKAYNKVIEPMDRLLRKGDISAEALQESRVILAEVFAKKKRNANLKELVKETELAVWQFKVLKDKAPEVCVQRAHGRPFRELASVMPKDYIQQEADMMVAYIKNPKRPENIIVDSENGAKLFTELTKKSVAELGAVNMDPSENDTAAQEKVCKTLITIHEKMLSASEQNIYDMYTYLNK